MSVFVDLCKNMKTLKYEEIELIGVLTISRPEALNAFNSELLGELGAFLDHFDKGSKARCLIITGAGEKAFVAGADIKELADLTPDQAVRFAERGQKTFRRLEILKVPVIAAVNGFALGGGCELALSCDFMVASTRARLGLPEVSLGVLPGWGGTQRLARAVGAPRARELIYTGRQLRAEEALEWGLVNQVVEPEALMESCLQLARAIASRGPIAVANAKQSLNQGLDLPLDEGLSQERDLFGDLFRTADQKEGTRAFIEKRTPNFRGA